MFMVSGLFTISGMFMTSGMFMVSEMFMVHGIFILIVVLLYIIGVNSLYLGPTPYIPPCSFQILLLPFLVFVSLLPSRDSPCYIYLQGDR